MATDREGRHTQAHTVDAEQRDEPDMHHPEPAVAPDDDRPDQPVEPEVVEERRVLTKPARTSVAAVLALVCGLVGLLAVATFVFAPLGLPLAIAGVVLGVVGFRMSRRVGLTGRWVAITGLVLGALALLLVIIEALGVVTVLNDEAAVDRLEQRVTDLRDQVTEDLPLP